MTPENGMENGKVEEHAKRERETAGPQKPSVPRGFQSSLSSLFPIQRASVFLSFPTDKKKVSDHGRFLGLLKEDKKMCDY